MTLCPSHRQTILAMLVGTAVGCAYGQEKEPERLKLRVGATRTEDSNYLRLPESKAIADQVNSQTLDVSVAFPFGQQRVDIDANLTKSEHQTATRFDFLSQNYSAAWRWSLSPRLLGVLSSKHTESLNSAADSIDPTLRNRNVTNLDTLSLGYLLGGPWHLLAEYSTGTSANEQALLGVSDVRYESYTAGFSYSPSSDRSLSYARRVDSGTNTSVLTGLAGYNYTGDVFSATYAFTSNTSLKARLGYLEQHFPLNSSFDFSGVTGGVDATWRITGKTTLTGGWQREITSFQTLDSTYAQTDTFTLAPTWQAGPTLSVGLQFRQGLRDAMGGLNGIASTRRDRTYDQALTVVWHPRRYVSLRASATQSNRTSTAVDQDYSASAVVLGALFIY